MFVIDNQKSGALPQRGDLPDLVINLGNKFFSRQHIVIRVLIGGQYLAAAGTGMVGVIRLNETIFRQVVGSAIRKKIRKRAKVALVFEQIHNFHGGAGLVKIIKLGGVTAGFHALINRRSLVAIGIYDIKNIHV